MPACINAQTSIDEIIEPENLPECLDDTTCTEIQLEDTDSNGQSTGLAACAPNSIAVFESLPTCNLENQCDGDPTRVFCIPTDPENDLYTGRCMQRCSLAQE